MVGGSDAMVGARVLGEVEEATMEEILDAVRAATMTKPPLYKLTHIPELDHLQAAHLSSTKSPSLHLSGRPLPLLYHLISLLLSPPHEYTIYLLDLSHRFDPTRLTCAPSELKHLYVHRPPISAVNSSHERVRQLVGESESLMVYGEAGRADKSGGRRWWGTMVLGATGGGGDLGAGWKGWVRVQRATVGGFAMGISAEEAKEGRAKRESAVDEAGWRVDTDWGGFGFRDEEDAEDA